MCMLAMHSLTFLIQTSYRIGCHVRINALGLVWWMHTNTSTLMFVVIIDWYAEMSFVCSSMHMIRCFEPWTVRHCCCSAIYCWLHRMTNIVVSGCLFCSWNAIQGYQFPFIKSIFTFMVPVCCACVLCLVSFSSMCFDKCVDWQIFYQSMYISVLVATQPTCSYMAKSQFECLKVLSIHITYDDSSFPLQRQTCSFWNFAAIDCQPPVSPVQIWFSNRQTISFADCWYTATCQSIKLNVCIEYLLVNIYTRTVFLHFYIVPPNITNCLWNMNHERVKYSCFLSSIVRFQTNQISRSKEICVRSVNVCPPNSYMLICSINILIIVFFAKSLFM